MTAESTGIGTAGAGRRVCFLLHLRPEKTAEYLKDHEQVWPEMLDALHAAGWRNYTLFHRDDDGLVVGYFETDDLDAALAAMEAAEVNARWQERMAAYFQPATGTGGQPLEQLSEYFHLD